MQLSDFLKTVSERLSQALPPELHTLKKDWDKTVQSVITSTFAKFDVVTRDEFDAQTKVLARTRQKVEHLEAELAKLEQLINRTPTND